MARAHDFHTLSIGWLPTVILSIGWLAPRLKKSLHRLRSPDVDNNTNSHGSYSFANAKHVQSHDCTFGFLEYADRDRTTTLPPYWSPLSYYSEHWRPRRSTWEIACESERYSVDAVEDLRLRPRDIRWGDLHPRGSVLSRVL